MLPEVHYAQLLVDVNRDVPFLEELGHWNTKYLALAFTELERLGLQIPDGEIAGVHNAQHEHINLIGYHDINLHAGPRKGNHRPLRQPAELRALLGRTATNRTATNA